MIIIGWSEKEKDILIQAYKYRTPIKTIEELKDKTNASISAVARTLGLDKSYPDFDYMVGQRFSYLTVLRKLDPKQCPCGTFYTMYECLCDCGNITNVAGGSLRSDGTKSCGCKKRELNSNAKKEVNKYDLNGEYGIGYDDHNNEFYFDKEDYEIIKDYKWNVDTSTGYVISTDASRNYAKIRMHRLIMGLYPGNNEIFVDHIHTENKTDNRKANLRIATRSQNGMNMKMMPQNTSGITGVSYKKDKGLWVAYITVNGKRIWLGSSKDFNKAVRLRKDAEEKYFGDRSYDKSQTVVID